MSLLKGILLALSLLAIGATVIAIVVTQIEHRQARQNKQLKFDEPAPPSSQAKVAVIYFSRSGNTGVAAHHLAKTLNADTFQIEANDYELGIPGWINSLNDARKHEADISPATIDLSQYETVYLGAPIWLYSPAPPIWQFLRNHRFDGQRVVLFNTFNSKFEQSYIDSFQAEAMQRGASNFEHLFVKRGRMGQQISPDKMTDKMDTDWKLVPIVKPENP